MCLNSISPEHRLLRITRRAKEISAARKPVAHSYAATAQRSVTADADSETAGAGLVTTDGIGGDGVEGSRRRFGRVTVSSGVFVRRLGSFNFEAALHEVSVAGCRVEVIEPCAVGDDVVTRFPNLEPLGARVCWSAGTTAGLEFAHGMHPAVFDALLVRLSVAAA